MSKKALGRSGIQVPPLTFGGNVFGWTADEATSFSLLDALVANELNFIDTADVYSSWAPGNKGGESETVIGNWLKKSGKRDRVIIATKVGKPMGEGKQGLSPRYIRQAVEDSLRRLQTDYIDLYQSHDDDRDTPLAETLAAFDELIKAGKVRAIGASNYQADRLVEALKVSEQNGLARYETLQPEYNLYAREGYEQALEAVAQQHDLGVINFFSLASGFLTGKYRSEKDIGKSQRGDTIVNRYLNPRGFRILAALDQVAEKYHTTPAQISLAWLIARPSITAPIVSATSLKQLDELVSATRVQLDAGDIKVLNEASAW
ncbi:aryl-alcohol dehydrogenase-like predicted oxidoreductase [Serratia fonticola]|uniref:Aryl-alcohol dehydrogenase-like predicted oxidoreductase n=1 Tax=Serratia fonticola TaxID=47917 RepID=A0A542CZY5_SERFO|nr:aldo/keto reductase [Serratia fonticola]TQI81666.1 aryl-alcohol dehydrogenase-like predicted oxidoreductase [Serratia fonticola]TQI96310.1 aryl-alcohol dehydrogenase-like predicted oxidoreductase [Serratia fonticola]TVZ70808.1 aryl-alcohol dehydrogenase-like predicted oxidoreductase [Serratia fonticola]